MQPATVLKAGPCVVVQGKTAQADGYEAVQLGLVEDKTPKGVPPLKHFLEHSITGLFEVGKADEMLGPFEDNVIVTDPMNNALGVKPKHDPYVKTARMCGSCHTINLPVVD